MKLISVFLLGTFLATTLNAQGLLSEEDQIKSAVQAAPASERDGATVIGYNSKKEYAILRKGKGNLVCLANNPDSKSFSVACYHKDLDPFMARGRALKLLGKNTNQIEMIREAEAKSGVLKMPKHPSALYVLYGANANYDVATKKVINGNLRYVVYIPWATAASTGLPLSPYEPGGPWLMFPGTYKAHIMITPPSQ